MITESYFRSECSCFYWSSRIFIISWMKTMDNDSVPVFTLFIVTVLTHRTTAKVGGECRIIFEETLADVLHQSECEKLSQGSKSAQNTAFVGCYEPSGIFRYFNNTCLCGGYVDPNLRPLHCPRLDCSKVSSKICLNGGHYNSEFDVNTPGHEQKPCICPHGTTGRFCQIRKRQYRLCKVYSGKPHTFYTRCNGSKFTEKKCIYHSNGYTFVCKILLHPLKDAAVQSCDAVEFQFINVYKTDKQLADTNKTNSGGRILKKITHGVVLGVVGALIALRIT